MIAHARTIDDVDSARVIAWGSSFGGGHALYLAARDHSLAARDHSLAAVIAQVPHISGPASAFARSPQLVARLILAGAYDQLGALLGREPYRVDAVGEPGSFAMMTSPDAVPMAIRLAGDRYEELLPDNNVAARIALRVPFYSPGRSAKRITAPTLIQLAKHDIVTPYNIAMKAAKQIPNGEIRSYNCSHFEPYLEPHFDTVSADQIDFLKRHV